MMEIMWSKEYSIAGGSENLYSHFGNQFDSFWENWESVFLKSQQYHSWAYRKGCTLIPQGQILEYFHSRIIWNSHDLENNLAAPQHIMDKNNVLYLYNEVKLSG